MGRDKNSLGRALVKDRFGANRGKKRVDNGSMLHTTEVQDGYDWGRLNLQSVTEQSSFQEFLSTAEMAGTEFQAEKRNLKLMPVAMVDVVTSPEARAKAERKHAESKHLLRVPRRPKWSKGMTAEQLSENEKQAFLDWRRELSLLQEKEGIIMTPYEKNLEFWRQLWRVLERSQVLVQVLDARNPLLFRCEDLESYAKEVGMKSSLLLLNKADLLSERQRNMWAEYFDKQGVKVVFFSAVLAAEQIKLERKKQAEEDEREDEESDEDKEESSEDDEDLVDDVSNIPILNTVGGLLEGINKLDVAVSKTAEKIKSFGDKLTKLAEMEPAAHVVKTKSNEDLTIANNNENSDAIKSNNGDETNVSNIPIVEKLSEDSVTQTDTKINEDEKSKKCVSFDSNVVDSNKVEIIQESSSSNQGVDCKIIEGTVKNGCEILTREQLLELFSEIGKEFKTCGERFTVGLVGYPNVGKSSTINALMTTKKVSVSATPGKTKHFQTLMLNEDLMLCDCPGLVLPSFVCTKADMVVHGILPIDQMREYMEAVGILSECLGGRKAAESKLGIMLSPGPSDNPDQLSPRALLLAYAYSRGMMSGAGTPDCARAARALLHSACQGKLSVAQPPPGVTMDEFREVEDDGDGKIQTRDMTPREKRALKYEYTADDLDNAFFKGPGLAAHAKGVQGKFSGLPKVRVRTLNGTALHEMEVSGKPWKHFNKHANKKKKEKLRRVYQHLDEH